MRTGFFWILFCFYFTATLFAQPVPKEQIISYGNDLNLRELKTVDRDFPLPSGLKPDQIKNFRVTNEEEWNLLKGLVPESDIGPRAIAAVYMEKLPSGNGLRVDTKNVTLINSHMYANALATAGVSDSRVFVTAPTLVTGITALVGIFRSYQELNGELAEQAKRTAAREMVQTGDLGEKIGKERAAVLLQRSKEEAISKQMITKEEVRKIVDQAAQEQNLSLDKEEKEDLVNLLLALKELNLKPEHLRAQLKNYTLTTPRETPSPPPAPQSQSLIAKIIAFFQDLFNRLFSFTGKIFRV